MRSHLPLTLAFAILLGIPPAHSTGVPRPAGGPAPTALTDSIRYATRVAQRQPAGRDAHELRLPREQLRLPLAVARVPAGLELGASHARRALGRRAGHGCRRRLHRRHHRVHRRYGGGQPAGHQRIHARGPGHPEALQPAQQPGLRPPGHQRGLDFIGFFSDEPARTLTPENHRPLNLLVRQEVYGWSWGGLQHSVFLRYVISNQGAATLTNLWAGLYTELASGSRTDYVDVAAALIEPGGQLVQEEVDPVRRIAAPLPRALLLQPAGAGRLQPQSRARMGGRQAPGREPRVPGGRRQARDAGGLDLQPGQRAARPGRRALCDHESGHDPGRLELPGLPAVHGGPRRTAGRRPLRQRRPR